MKEKNQSQSEKEKAESFCSPFSLGKIKPQSLRLSSQILMTI